MLHQNWFTNPRFEMFEDYGESQSFYDTKTDIIYVVFEEYEQKGSTIIQEITNESSEYESNYEKYKRFKSENKQKKIRKYLDEIYKESEILPENFGEEILLEVTDRFVEDGYEISKQNVLEELLWCYMCKMQ